MQAGLEVAVIDLTAPAMEALGLRTVKVLVPGAYPMNFDGRFPHFGGARMRRAPVVAGLRETPIDFKDLLRYLIRFPNQTTARETDVAPSESDCVVVPFLDQASAIRPLICEQFAAIDRSKSPVFRAGSDEGISAAQLRHCRNRVRYRLQLVMRSRAGVRVADLPSSRFRSRTLHFAAERLRSRRTLFQRRPGDFVVRTVRRRLLSTQLYALVDTSRHSGRYLSLLGPSSHTRSARAVAKTGRAGNAVSESAVGRKGACHHRHHGGGSRLLHRYGDRGYRYLLIEAGHVGQNLALVANASGLAA